MDTENERTDKGLTEKIGEKFGGTGVGTEDPNIVGDAGPTDVPPGKDPDTAWQRPEIAQEGEITES